MKVSKLIPTSHKVGNLKNTSAKVKAFKHEFCVLSADEVNNNRSKAYQYLTL